jgi:hypothetical protein
VHASFVVTGTSDARFELLKLAVIHESDHGAQGNQSTPVGECWIPVAALLSTELDETGVDERQWEEDALHSNTGLDGPRSDGCATGSGDGGGERTAQQKRDLAQQRCWRQHWQRVQSLQPCASRAEEGLGGWFDLVARNRRNEAPTSIGGKMFAQLRFQEDINLLDVDEVQEGLSLAEGDHVLSESAGLEASDDILQATICPTMRSGRPAPVKCISCRYHPVELTVRFLPEICRGGC